MFDRVVFIIPCYNAAKNVRNVIQSLIRQSSDTWSAVFIDDASDDDTAQVISSYADERLIVKKNDERKFALRNVVETVKEHCSSVGFKEIVAIVDADDMLCNDQTVSLIRAAYEENSYSNRDEHEAWIKDCRLRSERGESIEYTADVIRMYEMTCIWTAHRWDTNGMNISNDLPKDVDPYQYPWVSSHLKTFLPSVLDMIPESNFKDMDGRWFKRGYDQALYLPILRTCKIRKYIKDVCYQYNMNSVSITRTGDETDQLRTINMVRSRGFMNG